MSRVCSLHVPARDTPRLSEMRSLSPVHKRHRPRRHLIGLSHRHAKDRGTIAPVSWSVSVQTYFSLMLKFPSWTMAGNVPSAPFSHHSCTNASLLSKATRNRSG